MIETLEILNDEETLKDIEGTTGYKEWESYSICGFCEKAWVRQIIFRNASSKKLHRMFGLTGESSRNRRSAQKIVHV